MGHHAHSDTFAPATSREIHDFRTSRFGQSNNDLIHSMLAEEINHAQRLYHPGLARGTRQPGVKRRVRRTEKPNHLAEHLRMPLDFRGYLASHWSVSNNQNTSHSFRKV